MKAVSLVVVFACLCSIVLGVAVLPNGLPNTFQIGMTNIGLDGIPFSGVGYYYQYLTGDVFQSNWYGWQDTSLPPGQFVADFVANAILKKVVPVFTYYMIVPTAPYSDNADGSVAKFKDPKFVNSYLNNLQTFFTKAKAGSTVIFHFEPDLLGYLQRYSGGDATKITVALSSSGFAGVGSFPNNLRGLIQAINYIRTNTGATNVILAVHVSVWGTNVDVQRNKPDNPTVLTLARQSSDWIANVDPNRYFTLAFFEFSDRDSAFYCSKDASGAPCTPNYSLDGSCCSKEWWNEADFTRNILYVTNVLNNLNLRGIFWQIPFGNTKMRAMNNQQYHYQDNKVEWFLGGSDNSNMDRYNQAGVIALLYGSGIDVCTSITDTASDGVTNPAAINGNNLVNTSPFPASADDGGYFYMRTSNYSARGYLSLASGSASGASPSSSPGPSTTRSAAPSTTRTAAPSTTRSAAPSTTRTASTQPSNVANSVTPSRSISSVPSTTATRTSTPSKTINFIPSASSAPVSGGKTSLPVFTGGSLKNTWALSWSWAQTWSISGATSLTANKPSITYTPIQWDGIYFTCSPSGGPSCFDGKNYTVIYLQVHGGTVGGQKFLIQLAANGQNSGPQLAFTATKGAWTKFTFKLSDFGATSTSQYMGFVIQSAGNSNNAPAFFDSIYILTANNQGQITYPSSKKRDLPDLNIEALASVWGLDVNRVQNTIAGDSFSNKRQAAGQVTVVGLSAAETSVIQNTADWVPAYNEQTASSWSAADVAVNTAAIDAATGTVVATGATAGLSTGAIVGIVIGSVVGGVLVLGLAAGIIVGGVIVAKKVFGNNNETYLDEEQEQGSEEMQPQKTKSKGINVIPGRRQSRFKSITARAPSIYKSPKKEETPTI
eukprot:TRINITY_DN5929_c0_g1_i2.p1 TRINITY_DN5929_c0_g1~~TRINITY_DN5929_c0_g1_i2.p1  ORF type:complete len:895 (-),score=201.35 TRINITY_DN5929_c0_g1_i2:114-2774(-)